MTDVELFRAFQKSPLLFIEKNWGLVPQPIKEEHRERVAAILLLTFEDWETAKEDISPDWFEPFEKGKHITWQQWVILLCVEKALKGEAKSRISVESGHGTGKSASLSWLLLWFLFCFKDAQIPCTAPTSTQIHDILWKEVALWIGRMPPFIRPKFDWSNSYVKIVERPETWFARAATGNKENPEALAGVHGDYVMYLVDEASAVPDQIFNTAEGALTGKEFLFLMISNHTRLIGYFHDSHNSDKANWQRVSLDSRESPIVEPGFVERIIGKHGEDSDEFRIRVAGTSPKADGVDDQGYTPLFAEADVHWCSDAPREYLYASPFRRMGIDPSGEGDDETIWAVRDRFKAKVVGAERISTPKTIAQRTLVLVKEFEVDGENVTVDNFGEGANVGKEILLSSEGRTNVACVNVGDQAEDPARFINIRAEMYQRLKDWLRQGGELVNDPVLKRELLSIRVQRAGSKMKLMSKREMRKAGYPSPNRADALALSFVSEDPPYLSSFAGPADEPFDRFGITPS